MSLSKFHTENDVIITTTDAITVQEVYNYLSENLEKFRVGSQFIVACGVHGSAKGELGCGDIDLVADYHAMFEWFHLHERYPRVAKIVEERDYRMGTVLTMFSKRDKNRPGKYVLQEHCKAELKTKFEDLLTKQVSTVLILASCWSYRSEICNILRSTGLLTVLNILEERAKITNGNILRLDQEQQDFFRTICNVILMIKDIILAGIMIHCDIITEQFKTTYHNLKYISLFFQDTMELEKLSWELRL